MKSLDDPALKSLKIGVQMIGDDGSNTPPAHALAARGLVHNVVGFTVYGDYREQNPPARIIDAVANGDIDVAVAWGPMAGYFAKRQRAAGGHAGEAGGRAVRALDSRFGIAMGVRKGNKELRDEVDAILKKRKAEIDRILDDVRRPARRRAAEAGRSGDSRASESRSLAVLDRWWSLPRSGAGARSASYRPSPPFGGRCAATPKTTRTTPTPSRRGSGCSPRSTASAATPTAAGAWARR